MSRGQPTNETRVFRIRVRQVACPQCSAEAGRKCVGIKGQLRSASHQERVDLYRSKLMPLNEFATLVREESMPATDHRTRELTTDAQELREAFERLASDPSYKFARSRKGTYVNPAVARDWKWFQLGAKQVGQSVVRERKEPDWKTFREQLRGLLE